MKNQRRHVRHSMMEVSLGCALYTRPFHTFPGAGLRGGNDHGFATTTYSMPVSKKVLLQSQSMGKTYLAFTICPKIYTYSYRIIYRWVRSLIQQRRRQSRNREDH